MSSRSSIASALIVLSALATTCLLAGCSPTLSTQTAATEAGIAADVCRAWQPVTYSSRDTEQTQVEARANNAARAAYCGDKHTMANDRDLGRIEGKLDAMLRDIEEGADSRRRIHEKLEGLAGDMREMKRDVRDVDERLEAIEPTVADISKWRERGIGAVMLVSFAAASIGGLVATYGRKLWAALTGQ